jgi:hypothetical protein
MTLRKSNHQVEIGKNFRLRCCGTIHGLLAGFALLAFVTPLVTAATVLDDAEAFYKLDFANSGAVTGASEISDSSGKGHHATTIHGGGNLSWTAVPATGPMDGPAIGHPADSGLSFAQPAFESPGQAGFQVARGLSLSGSQAVMSRIYWQGHTHSSLQTYIFNVGLDRNGKGFIFGIRRNGRDNVLGSNTSPIPGESGEQNRLAANLKLEKNTWYDIGISWNADDCTLTFYLGSKAHGVQSQVFTDIVLPQSSPGYFRVGGEGFSAKSKTFKGMIDYVAVFDRAITEAEFTAAISSNP